MSLSNQSLQPVSKTPQSLKSNSNRLRRVAWLCLILGLLSAGGGLRLVSGWLAGLRRIFSDEVVAPGGPIYTLEVATGLFFWLSPFLLAGAGVLFAIPQNQKTEPKSVQTPKERINPPLKIILTALLLGLVALIHLWPLLQPDWTTIAPDYDEGVHLLAARQFALGFQPYREYFFTHPPAAIYGFLPAAFLGNGGPDTIWLGRFTVVLWSVGTAWLVYACGRKLYDWTGALIALLVYGLDGWGVFIGHEALLEFQLNFFSFLAFWAFLNYEKVQSPESRVQSSQKSNSLSPDTPEATSQSSVLSLPPLLWLLLCGVALALACLTRLNGAVVVVALVGYLLVRRRWKALIWLIGAGLVAGLALALPLVLVARGEFIKQVILFQLLRGGDGVATGPQRFDIFSVSAQASFSLICAWLGAFGLVLGARWGQKLSPVWLVIAGWLGLNLIFFTFSKAFYLHYYISLLPLLALVAGGLSNWLRFLPQMKNRVGNRSVRVALLLVLGISLLGAWQTYGDKGNYPGPQNVGWLVQAQTPPGTTVLTLYGLDTFFSDRPLPSTTTHEVLIDHYGAFSYNVLGLNKKSTFESFGLLFSRTNPTRFDATPIINNFASQNLLNELNARAAYTVIGDFGKQYVSPATKSAWVSRSYILLENNEIWFYANRAVYSKS
jgi:4-amino-4-deoxy-L-arabinose transferase-like glycosyltransferase